MTNSEIAIAFADLIPKGYRFGWVLEFNPHLKVHCDVRGWLDLYPYPPDWMSEEDKALAISTNTAWVFDGYTGRNSEHIQFAASTLDALLAYVIAHAEDGGITD